LKIIALISAFEEEDLLDSCIESAADLDEIFVFDGTVDAEYNFKENRSKRLSRLHVPYWEYHGIWKSDADKRTDMLMEAKAWDHDAWGLWLDGDEILLYGQYLKDHANRADRETGSGGFTIRIVEYDGSVAQCYGKIIKLGNVSKYLMSSYEIELESGLTIALPNVPICSSGGIPIGEITKRDDPILALNRPPVIGEPHLLHRHGLRDPERSVKRLHDKEAEDFQTLVEESKSG
jgi:hypothetical protein